MQVQVRRLGFKFKLTKVDNAIVRSISQVIVSSSMQSEIYAQRWDSLNNESIVVFT